MAYTKVSNKTQDKEVRYLNKDFNSFKQQLIEFTKVYYPDTFNDFSEAIRERKTNGFVSETTFIGINSADIKDYNQINNMFEVTVDFVSEIISCVQDKDKKLVSGDPKKVKKVYDTWKFSRDTKSLSPNWLLIDTQA